MDILHVENRRQVTSSSNFSDLNTTARLLLYQTRLAQLTEPFHSHTNQYRQKKGFGKAEAIFK